jgi:O-succinylbenzoic acid--CoA ligase
MNTDFLNIHPGFKLNRKHYNAQSLLTLAESLNAVGDSEEKEMAAFLLDWLYPRETVLVKTSGSTGDPKTITLSKAKMIESAKATGAFFDLSEKTKALHCLPIQFIAGKMMLVRAMMLGWEVDVVVPNRAPLSQTTGGYDFAALIPFQVFHSLKDLNRVKKVIIGGGAVSESLRAQLQNTTAEVFATYGMTETITHVAIKKLNHINEGEHPYFEALPNVKFKQDNRRCLVIDAPNILEAPITTNDMVELISESQFEWLGRHDNIINSGGIKINPEVLENKLESQLDMPFFITSLPDEQLTEKVVLVIEGESQKIKDKVFTGFNKYEIPKHIYFLPNFVYTKNGKLRRKETLKLLIE